MKVERNYGLYYNFNSFFLTSPSQKNDNICGGEWSAARNVARKHKSVDCTGLELLSCRHQFGQKAINMKRGEIFGYAVYLMKTFVVPNSIPVVFADIMCKLWGYTVKCIPNISENTKGALSVMHAKGHSLECQVYN